MTGGIVTANPASPVRGTKHVVRRGKTPVLSAEQARDLLDSIDTSTLVGLRDRALIAVVTYAFARVGAVVAMRVEDYYPQGKRWWVRDALGCSCERPFFMRSARPVSCKSRRGAARA